MVAATACTQTDALTHQRKKKRRMHTKALGGSDLGRQGWSCRIGFRKAGCRSYVMEKEGAPAYGSRLLVTADRQQWRRERMLLAATGSRCRRHRRGVEVEAEES
jgi:hypothetical protein